MQRLRKYPRNYSWLMSPSFDGYCKAGCSLDWAREGGKFANPLPGHPLVVVEGACGTFTLENGVTRVSTNLYSNLNVEYMESKVLMGKLVGKQLDARTIKWKLVKNSFYFDHFGHRWYAIEFTGKKELEFTLDNRPCFIRADETILSSLNGLLIRVLLEVVLRLPLKRILVVNDDEECPLLLTYEKLFEVYFYSGRKRIERHSCPTNHDNDGYVLVDRIFEDEPLIYPADFPISEGTKKDLHDGVMLLFPQPTLLDEFSSVKGDIHARGDNTQEHLKEDEGCTPVLVRRPKSANRGRGSARRDG
ncbi:hypothetical protein D8674_017757 [Pyrus ussuriensis x Pyrus communis]|uniref:Uncharacterized protein n=1 Tax=Pyrus ussuriensis x Pyrus communis TaxID=2448454 RepID=A0A5N5HGT5_9ROSA|nr:hypothetical protein D8674_017757 [Pyrus ussuriensis x Pyrus communis]